MRWGSYNLENDAVRTCETTPAADALFITAVQNVRLPKIEKLDAHEGNVRFENADHLRRTPADFYFKVPFAELNLISKFWKVANFHKTIIPLTGTIPTISPVSWS